MPSISVVFHVHVCVWFVCVIINTTYQKTSGKQFFGEKKHLKLFWRTKHKTENKNQADIFHFSRGPFTLLSYVSSFPSSISFPKSENKSTCPEKVNLLHLLQHDGFVDGNCEIRKMDQTPKMGFMLPGRFSVCHNHRSKTSGKTTAFFVWKCTKNLVRIFC